MPSLRRSLSPKSGGPVGTPYTSAPMPMHPIHRRFYAEELVRLRRAGERRRHIASQRRGRVDPNPHQIDAVMFALRRIPQGGCILADEVGLGKTIEAGLIIAQLMAEHATRILIVVPRPLLGQWQDELSLAVWHRCGRGCRPRDRSRSRWRLSGGEGICRRTGRPSPPLRRAAIRPLPYRRSARGVRRHPPPGSTATGNIAKTAPTPAPRIGCARSSAPHRCSCSPPRRSRTPWTSCGASFNTWTPPAPCSAPSRCSKRSSAPTTGAAWRRRNPKNSSAALAR